MNWIIFGLIFVAILILAVTVAGLVYWFVISKKGRKVLIHVYESRNEELFRVYAKKKLIGQLLRVDGVEVIKLPKVLSQFGIEGVSPSFLIPGDAGLSILNLHRDGAEIFRPMRITKVDNQKYKSEIQSRAAVSFYLNNRTRRMDKYNTQGWWGKYGGTVTFMITMAMCIVAFFLTVYQTNGLVDDFWTKYSDGVEENHNLLVDMVNNLKEKPSDIDTNAEKPPAQNGQTT